MRRYMLGLAVAMIALAAPTAALAAPPAPPSGVTATASSDTAVQLTWLPRAGAVRYRVVRNQDGFGAGPQDIFETTQTTFLDSPVEGGQWYYKVCSINAAGEVGCPPRPVVNVTVVGDDTPPTVSITTPAAGASIHGTVRVVAHVQDDVRVCCAHFLVDGEPIGATGADGMYAADIDTTPLTNGDHTISVVARDWDRNETIKHVPVVVDNQRSASIVAAYGFEDGSGTLAADRSGHGRAGSVLGARWASDGRFGGALAFDGSNDRVDLPALGTFYKKAFTLEAWVRKTGTKSDVAVVGSWASGTLGGPMLWVDYLSGRYTQTMAKGALSYLDSGSAPVAGTWQHLTTTYDGATVRFYLDGVQVATRAFTGNAGDTDLWRIGAYGPGPGGYFDGAIDEVRIYKRALTAAEVEADMTEPVVEIEPPPPPAAPADVRASAGVRKATLAWDAVDGATRYDVHRSATAGIEPSAENRIARVTENSYTDSGLEPGAYHYVIRAQDAFGQFGPPSDEARVEVIQDTAAPEVELQRPTAGTMVSGAVPLEARATDDVGLARVDFEIDGEVVAEGNADGDTYNGTWNSSEAANGSHRVVAVARDQAGNETRTAEVAFSVDNASGLVASYTFDDGAGMIATDSSGHGFHGTIDPGATWTEGKYGGALAFDGHNGRVTMPTLAFPFGAGFTFEAWVKKTGLKRDVGVVGTWSAIRHGGPMIWVDHLVGRYRLTTGRDLPGYLDSGRTPVVGEWQHLAATYNGLTARFYVDGVEVGSLVSDLLGSGQIWRIGAYGPGHEGYFDGLIDDVKIYSRPLSAAEIRDDLDGPGEQPPDTSAPTAPTDLTVTRATWRAVSLQWSPSSDDVGVARYTITRDGTSVGTATEPSFTVEGLACGQTYELGVEARDGAGNTSARTTVQATTAGCESPGLVAAYSLDENANDASPNGKSGTVVGATQVPGKYGNAFRFGGPDFQRIDLPPLGKFYKQAFTLEAWVNGVSRDGGIVGTWIGSEGGGPMLWVDNVFGRYHLTLAKGSANYLDSGQMPVAGQWQHVAATYDGQTARFYLNGTEVASRAFTGNVGDSNTWRIGAYDRKGLAGIVDEVRIYDRAISAAEVHSDMETPIDP